MYRSPRSIEELEATLRLVGDTEVDAIKSKVENLYDGKVQKLMYDHEYGEVKYAFIETDDPTFEGKSVYIHKTHLQDFYKMGDTVRFAVHVNHQGQPQVSFMDRLNNRLTGLQKRGSKF